MVKQTERDTVLVGGSNGGLRISEGGWMGGGDWSELGNQGAWCQLKCDEVRMHMHVCASKHNNVNEKLAPPPPYACNIPSLSGRRSRAWRRINARAAYHLYLSLLWFPVITHLFHFTLPAKLRIFIVFSLIQQKREEKLSLTMWDYFATRGIKILFKFGSKCLSIFTHKANIDLASFKNRFNSCQTVMKSKYCCFVAITGWLSLNGVP